MTNHRDICRHLSESYIHEDVRGALQRLRTSRCLGIKQGSLSWHRFRASHITSTDAAVILTQSAHARDRLVARKHDAARKLQESGGTLRGFDYVIAKLNEEAAHSSRMAPALAHGHKYEAIAAAVYAQMRGVTLTKIGVIEHPDHSWLSASPDRIDITTGSLVEIKCPYSRRVPSVIPRAHWIQMQIAMACSGIHRCTYVELSVDPKTRPAADSALADNVCYYRDIEYDDIWFQTNVRTLFDTHADVCRITNKRIAIFKHQPTDESTAPTQRFAINNRTCTARLVDMQGKPTFKRLPPLDQPIEERDSFYTTMDELEQISAQLPPLTLNEPMDTLPDNLDFLPKSTYDMWDRTQEPFGWLHTQDMSSTSPITCVGAPAHETIPPEQEFPFPMHDNPGVDGYYSQDIQDSD